MFRSIKKKLSRRSKADPTDDSLPRTSSDSTPPQYYTVVNNVNGVRTSTAYPPLHQPSARLSPRSEPVHFQPPLRPGNPPPAEEPEHEQVPVPVPVQEQEQEQELAPEPEPELEQEPRTADPFAPKYVPFVDATPLKNNMLAGTTSIYGRVNPDIMGGFGGDDDSIWLVDDEESDEEQLQLENGTPPDTIPDDRPTPDPRPVHQASVTSMRMSLHDGDDVPGAAALERDPYKPTFSYQRPTFIDDEVQVQITTDNPPDTNGHPPQTERERESNIAFRGYAPVSISILDLNDLGIEETVETGNHDISNQDNSVASLDPYVAMFNERNALTHRRDDAVEDFADDFSFGQRYQQAVDTTDVIVTRQRVPAAPFLGEIECMVCVESKSILEFPRYSITASCTHPPNTCLDCVQLSIESDLSSKLWTEIRCPECREQLEYADIQRYANKQTFERYELLALRAAMSQADNFIWCTAGCGSGQIHDSGTEQPIVVCLHCSQRSCFHHNVPWHESLTCEEYDRLLADPDNFRSRVEMENEEWSETQRAQLETDRAMAQGLMAEEQAEIKRREDRARQEREQAKKAAELVRKIAARRKEEDLASVATISHTTKPCPGCGWAIEKNDGCSHMTCIKCRHQYCFECGADHEDIMKNDNTAHKDTCKFHPDNLADE